MGNWRFKIFSSTDSYSTTLCHYNHKVKPVIDIGKSELAAGCTFVAISQLPSLEAGLIVPMTFQRLQQISNGRNFSARLQEDARLKNLT